MSEYEEQSIPPPVGSSGSSKVGEVSGLVGGIFGAGTLLAFIIGRIWKWWTEQKSTDSAGTVVVAANEVTAQTIRRQEERIQQLENRIGSLEIKVEQEGEARRKAQEENIRLRVRNAQLVALLATHGIDIPQDYTG